MLYEVYCNWQRIRELYPLSLLLTQVVGLFIVAFLLTPYWKHKKTMQMFNPVDWNSPTTTVVKKNKWTTIYFIFSLIYISYNKIQKISNKKFSKTIFLFSIKKSQQKKQLEKFPKNDVW